MAHGHWTYYCRRGVTVIRYFGSSVKREGNSPWVFQAPVTLVLQNGANIKTVSGMLGHFSAGFTLDTYAHVTSAAQRQAAQTMGNVLSSSL